MKSRNIFLGILFLFAGVVALLAVLGVFEFHWATLWSLWPMLLIILGIAILPLNDYLKAAILLVALALGCLFYHAEENRTQEKESCSWFFHPKNWNIF